MLPVCCNEGDKEKKKRKEASENSTPKYDSNKNISKAWREGREGWMALTPTSIALC